MSINNGKPKCPNMALYPLREGEWKGCQGSVWADMSCPFAFLWETAHATLAGGTSLWDHTCLVFMVISQPALTTNLAPLERVPERWTKLGGLSRKSP